SVEAALASNLDQVETALDLSAQAAALYRRAKAPAGVASSRVQRASLLLAAGRHQEALDRAEVALRSLPTGEARLELLARGIVTESLIALGRPAEALRC